MHIKFYAILKAYNLLLNYTVKISEKNEGIAYVVSSVTDALGRMYELHMKLSNSTVEDSPCNY